MNWCAGRNEILSVYLRRQDKIDLRAKTVLQSICRSRMAWMRAEARIDDLRNMFVGGKVLSESTRVIKASLSVSRHVIQIVRSDLDLRGTRCRKRNNPLLKDFVCSFGNRILTTFTGAGTCHRDKTELGIAAALKAQNRTLGEWLAAKASCRRIIHGKPGTVFARLRRKGADIGNGKIFGRDALGKTNRLGLSLPNIEQLERRANIARRNECSRARTRKVRISIAKFLLFNRHKNYLPSFTSCSRQAARFAFCSSGISG